MKKLMSVLLALVLVLAMVPVAASADDTGPIQVSGLQQSGESSYDSLSDALSAVNQDQGDGSITITLSAGSYSATENEQFKITRDNVSLIGAGQENTIIAGGEYSCSGQAGFLVSGNNVTISNVTITSAKKDAVKVTKIADTAGLGLVTDFTLSNSTVKNEVKSGDDRGHGLNLHGVQGATITNVTAISDGKCAISVANSPAGEEDVHGVTVFGCTLSGAWGSIGLMYGEGNAYESPVDLVLGEGNRVGDGSTATIYSERPVTEENADSITFEAEVEGLSTILSSGALKLETAEGVDLPATNLVAEVNGVGYTTLQAAIDSAKDGDTVEVYAGTHDGSIVIDGKDITLEGPVGGEAVITISVDTASKIESQTAIAGETTPYSGIVAVKDATVTLKNLTIQGNAEAASAVNALTHTDRYAGLVVLDADVTVENCAITDITYTNGPDGLQGMQNGFGIYAVAASKHNLTLTNVDITNFNKAAAVIRSNVDLTMSGGSVTGYGAQAVISQNGIQYAGNATISGTTFSGLQYTAENEWKGGSTAIYNVGTGTESTIENVKTEEVDYAVSASASTNITGGIYAGKIYGEPVAEGEDSVLSISGGTYPDCDVTEYLEEGLEQNENGTVVKDTPSTPGGGTPSEPEEPTWPFEDVTEGDDWFYDAVAYVYENGIMAGTDETVFDPYMELDRAMAAQLFYNLEGKPAVTGDSTFTDVTSAHWAVDAITWAAQNDIVAGIGGGLYDPDSNVTREQFAVMLYKYARFKGYDLTATGDLTQFPDAGSISSWAETALSWANGNGLINGHENGTIDPKGSTIRAQAASIMANFDQNVAK